MGHMRSSATTVLCIALLYAAWIEAAPITGEQEQLISTIRDKAEAEVEEEKQKTSKYATKLDKETATLEANQQFVQNELAGIKEDDAQLKHMDGEENQAVADAKQLAMMAGNGKVSDSQVKEMVDKEHDAASLSEKIQREGERVEKSFQGIKTDLEQANVPRAAKKKASELGDNEYPEGALNDDGNVGSFQDRVKEVEASANAMVTSAEQKASETQTKEKASRQQLAELSTAATQGYKRLSKAEARLASDLNGHKDLRLEHDIEEKEADLQKRSRKRLGETRNPYVTSGGCDPSSDPDCDDQSGANGSKDGQTTDGSDQTTGDESAEEADNQDDTQADTNDDSGDPEKLITAKHAKSHSIQAKVMKITGAKKSNLGEGLSPELQAAEQAAENAASTNEGASTEQAAEKTTDVVDSSMPSPEAANFHQMQTQEAPAMATESDGEMADLNAIGEDAKALDEYQMSAKKEIEAIRNLIKV